MPVLEEHVNCDLQPVRKEAFKRLETLARRYNVLFQQGRDKSQNEVLYKRLSKQLDPYEMFHVEADMRLLNLI
jgi:hypothetical protein